MTGLNFDAVFVGLATAILSSLIIVITKKHHISLSSDSFEGVQKFHSAPTPRIGGLPLIFGILAAGFYLEADAFRILAWTGIAALPAFVLGLTEDIFEKGGVKARFIATLVSGVIFFFVTGYSVERVEVSWLDFFLANSVFSVAFTAFAIGSATNSVNIIDGFHGLASGTVLIILGSIGMVSWQVGDLVLLQIVLVIFSVTLGFFLINFPFGKLFLGDGGAYLLGFLVSALSVMLSVRNPEVSPWICPLILSYPLTELVVSISRKIRRDGHHPAMPDGVHLHMLVHGVIVKSKLLGRKPEAVQHAVTSLTLWSLPLLSLLLASVSELAGFFVIRSTIIIFCAYLALYSLIHIYNHRNKT
ncbi:hypothetical protein A9Q96_00300 [Rhodobacterales bacterium 52_120_T64]|nr:hypothetical protein A9Q96_00300 [Rhodobacterales bacterium 52_120_T64]